MQGPVLDLARERVSDPPLCILIVVEPGLDGVFRHVEGLVDYLLRKNARVHLAFSSRRSGAGLQQLVERVQIAGGAVLDMRVANIPEVGDSVAFAKLLRMIGRVRPDIIHAHSSKAGALARAAALIFRRPRFIYTPHAYYGMAKPLSAKIRFFNQVERTLGRRGKTVAISQDEAAFARQTLGVPPSHIHVIHNPVDTNRFTPASAEQRRIARADLGIPESAVVLGTIGRMCWQKDPETAYRGIAPVCSTNPDLSILHLGWGKWKEHLIEGSKNLGFGSQLRILDYTEDPRRIYHAIDGLLVSSRYEAGWPLVFLEAMACNLPAITSTCLGMSDVGKAGLSHVWTFERENVTGCTSAIRRWLDDHRAGSRPCNHRTFAVDRLSPDRCYGALFDLYLNRPAIEVVSPMA